ncbi:MAG: TonB-dependent receptor [Candidatus Acidiferrum sp.]
MSRRSVWVALVVFCFAFNLCTYTASGQAVYGSVIGTVTDAQGGGVVGAKVTVTSVTKGTTEETTTNESGNYSVTHLIPDTYRVKVESTGFKAYQTSEFPVAADTTVTVDAALVVGAVTEQIEVSAEIPQLKTEKTDVATVFTAKEVEDAPIFNRNFTTFQLLSPGAQQQGWGHAASENPQGSQQILTNGQPFAGTAFELDGTDNQDPILGIIVVNPNLESVSEIKITSQDYDAEFGKAIGAVVTSQTKSGTNELHGSIFDFERSNSNFARDPFTQANGVPAGNWNQFGAAVGGPIIKNRLFFFGDFQGQRAHVGGSAQDRIPTAAERAGDLSGIGKNIYDPYETTDATHQTLVLDGNGNPIPVAAGSRLQFPGNMIPASRLSPEAQALLALLPVGTDGTGLNQNFFGSGSNVLDANNFDIRSDFNATSKIQFFGRYSFQKFTRSGPGLFGDLLGGPALPADAGGAFSGTSNVKNQSVAIGADYTFSPSLLTDLRFGYFRYHVQTAPGGLGTTPASDAGIPGLNLGTSFTSGMPAFQIRIPSAQDFDFGYSLGVNQCNCPLTESEHQYQIVNNWTKIHGNHTFKFGADIRWAYNLRVPSDSHRAGQLDFNNDITAGPNGDGGVGLAGFLLGDVSHFERFISPSTNAYETQPRLFFYGQDTWRITNKLTVNLGLRWEIYKPESVPTTGGGGWLDLGTGEIRVAGQDGVDHTGNTHTDYKHFAPRLGVAYQINPKTVVRVGYGRSYDTGVFGTVFGHVVTQNLPVLTAQAINPGGVGSADFNSAFFLSQGPPLLDPATVLTSNNCNVVTDPTLTLTECLGANGRALLPDGVNSRARPFNNRLPTVDAWNVSFQRQVTGSISVTAAYVGNKGTHTFVEGNPAYNVNSRTIVGYDPNAADPDANRKSRTPYYSLYDWTQGIDYFGNDADNKYNALQLSVEKRFSGGLSIKSSYTFQHADRYQNNGYFNIDKTVGYGPNSDYRNHVFIFTQVYDLPFGKGRRYMTDSGRIADFFIGGWQINSNTNFSSGLPFTPSISSCSPSSDNGPCRPDIVGKVGEGTRSGSPRDLGYWFETTGGVSITGFAGETAGPWAQPALDTFGNVRVNSFRGPRFFDTNAALFKNFSITERVKFQLQFQFFNIFNHVSLGNPNTNVDQSNAGSINNASVGYQARSLTYGGKINF